MSKRSAVPDEEARAIGEKVADALFHNGSGEQADRLALCDKNGRNLGGWCWAAVRDRVAEIVSRRTEA
jgi:hypothetical protein